MKAERELFEEWVKKEHPHIYSGSLKDNEDSVRFKMDVDFMFSAWQASANREGYKLVPVDLIERCISHIGIASCHPANSLHDDQQMGVDIDALEKAMIGACDDH